MLCGLSGWARAVLQKRNAIKLKKIRDSARGQDCTIRSPWCSPGPENETVVLAHYHEPGHGTMGGKSDDTSAAYACNTCHDWLDGRFKPKAGDHPWIDKEFHWFRGMRETWRLFIENGVLK
jgi:hypothetical protein